MLLTFAKQNIFGTTTYVASDNRFQLVSVNDKYYIQLNSQIPEWQGKYGFDDVDSAEKFLNAHDWANATESDIKENTNSLESDLIFLCQMYYFSRFTDVEDGQVKFLKELPGGGYICIEPIPNHANIQEVRVYNSENNEDIQTYDLSEAAQYIDEVLNRHDIEVFSRIALCNPEHTNTVVQAAISSRDLTKNLVRVKSSNMWAYTINIRDRHDKVGDVIVQFKGPKGGPGDIYMYFDVPVNLWRKWLAAPSKGAFFWKYIRNNFWYRKLTGDKRGKLRNAIN